jgi:hypothetical protein
MSDSQNGSESYEREFQYYVALFRDKNDMADAFKAFGAAKTAMDGIKILTQYVDEIKDAQKHGELMRVISNLSLEMAETKVRLGEQLEKNSSLEQEIRNLREENKKLKSPDSKPIVKDGVYFVKEDGPFCTRCYDVEMLLVRVVATTAGTGMRKVAGNYRCPNCNAYF